MALGKIRFAEACLLPIGVSQSRCPFGCLGPDDTLPTSCLCRFGPVREPCEQFAYWPTCGIGQSILAVEHLSRLDCEVTLARSGVHLGLRARVGFTSDIDDSCESVQHERFCYEKAEAALSSVRRECSEVPSMIEPNISLQLPKMSPSKDQMFRRATLPLMYSCWQSGRLSTSFERTKDSCDRKVCMSRTALHLVIV
jgi:hypothetical protein